MRTSDAAPSESSARSRARRSPWLLAWCGLAAVLVLAGVPRFWMVSGSAPYVLHEDEPLTTRRAAKMLRTGDPNPRFFRYPSLPIYLTAGAFAAALLAHGESPDTDVGDVERIYERPEIALAARVLLVVLSLACMAMLGVVAARSFGSPLHLVLVPLAIASSARFLMMSWTYVNVDMFGAFVCSAAVLHVVLARERASLFHRAILPGLLTGLAAGCKYFLGVVGLPALLVLVFERKDPARRLTVIVLATLAGFLISTPFSVLDARLFAEHVDIELEHYRTGHRGAEADPGLPQLVFYARALATDFGPVASAVGLFGIAASLFKRPREAVLVLAFPLALLAFLCTQRVHFLRNALSLYAFFPAFVSYGVVAAGSWSAARLPRSAQVFGHALPVIALALAAPWQRIATAYGVREDSRNRTVAWILASVPDSTTVLVADELQLDTRRLEARPLEHGSLNDVVDRFVALPAGAAAVLVVPPVERGTPLEAHCSPARRRVLDGLEVLWSAGRNHVPLKPGIVVHLGDPLVQVLGRPSR